MRGFGKPGAWAGFAGVAVLALALACTREVERTVVVTSAPVERTVVVTQAPVERTVVVTQAPQVLERTVVVTQAPVERTVVVERTVQVVVTPTPAPATPTPAPRPTPTPRPTVWRIGIPADITTTNLWNILGPGATAYNFYTQLNGYPFLYGLSDVRFDWVPAWADGFPTEFVQEGEFWTTTAKLKSGVKWSDGKPITAHDVAFTVQTALDFELPGNWADLVDPAVVAKAEAVNDRTVKFYFKSKPGLARWQYGISGLNFVAKHFWEPLVNQARQAAGTVEDKRKALYAIVPQNEPKAGEMTFVKWETGAFVELKANPEYYAAGSTVTEYTNGAYVDEKPGVYRDVAYGTPGGDVALTFKRGPFAQSVIYSVYADQNSAVLALEKGEIDYMATPLGLQRGFKQRIDAVPNLKILTNAPNGIRYMGFNLRKPPMDNTPAGKAFRQAVATLIDKEFVTTSILQRVADPAYTMVPPGNGFYYNPKVPQWGKNAEGMPLTREQRINEAVRLLKGAGFTWEVEPKWNTDNRAVDAGRGLKMPNGEAVPQMELLAPSAGYDPLRSTFAIWIERWLNEAGIPLRANLTGFNVIVDRVFTEQDFDMWMLGWGLTVFPDYLENFFHSKYSEKEGNNAGGYSNPEFDKLAETLVAETDVNRAKEIAFKMQEFLADELPYVVLFTTQILEPVRTNVKFPFETVLDGVQNYFQSANGPLAYTQFQ